MLAFNSKKALKIKAFFISSHVFNSCRPHQNRVIMRNECINARFFCIFDSLMRSKIRFFDENPCFWRPFWHPHFNILSPYNKSPSRSFPEELFCIKLKFKLQRIHLSFFSKSVALSLTNHPSYIFNFCAPKIGCPSVKTAGGCIANCGYLSCHFPFVKSGNATSFPVTIDSSDKTEIAIHVAISYTSIGIGFPPSNASKKASNTKASIPPCPSAPG